MEMTRKISFLDEFKKGGCFESFTDLIRENDDLELLFRGNSGDNGQAIIYYHNNVVFRLSVSKKTKNIRITVNYDHLRYSKNWKDIISKDFAAYGFPKKDVEDINPKKYYEIGYASANFAYTEKKKIDREYVNGLYAISETVMKDYFCLDDKEKLIDRFRESCGVEQTGKAKPDYLEKANQQKFFSATSKLKGGLFVYDLEYKEPFQNKTMKKEALLAKSREKMNKPDCLAIRFDPSGIPISFAFIEMKSKKEAENGNSGTGEHLDGMMDDLLDKEFVALRIKEADQIIHDYKELRLKGLSENDDIPDIENYTNSMNTEIIVVYTDELAKGKKSEQKVASSDKYKQGIPYSVIVFSE